MRERNTSKTTSELMTPARAQKIDAIVEQAIDEFGLQRVLDSLARVCGEKAEHVNTNWQDPALAGWWARRGHLVERVATKCGMENT